MIQKKKPVSCPLCAELLYRVCDLPRVKREKAECVELMNRWLAGKISTEEVARIIFQRWRIPPKELDEALSVKLEKRSR